MRRYWGVEGATSQGHALLLFSGQKESTSIIYEILRHARNTIFSKAANHTQPQGKAEKWCIPAVASDWKLLSRRKKVSATMGPCYSEKLALCSLAELRISRNYT